MLVCYLSQKKKRVYVLDSFIGRERQFNSPTMSGAIDGDVNGDDCGVGIGLLYLRENFHCYQNGGNMHAIYFALF